MDTAGPLDSMSSRHRQVIVHVHPDIGMLDGIQDLAREFKIYKEQAFQYAEEEGMDAEEFLPALSKPDQEAFPPGHYLFGRDRLFTGGWLGYRARAGFGDRAANDALYHVHVYKPDDEKCIWHDEVMDVNQWFCRSDAALIYSYFDDQSGNFNFLLLELVDPGAHDAYEQDGVIVGWRKKADYYWRTLG